MVQPAAAPTVALSNLRADAPVFIPSVPPVLVGFQSGGHIALAPQPQQAFVAKGRAAMVPFRGRPASAAMGSTPAGIACDQDAVAGPQQELQVGQRARVHGIRSSPALNGQSCVCLHV